MAITLTAKCDAASCKVQLALPHGTLASARQHLRDEGWTLHRGNLTVCPAHKEK